MARFEKKVTIHDSGKVRITVEDYTILVEELPRKPCKRKLRRWSIHLGYLAGPAMALSEFLPRNVMTKTIVDPESSYEQIVAELELTLSDIVLHLPEDTRREVRAFAYPKGREKEVSYLAVTPADVKPIEVQGADFGFTAEWTTFMIYSPGSTMNYPGDGRPHYSAKEAKSPGAARKLYKIIKKDPNALKDVTWSKLHDWLNERKIGYEYRSSSWT